MRNFGDFSQSSVGMLPKNSVHTSCFFLKETVGENWKYGASTEMIFMFVKYGHIIRGFERTA